MTSITVTMIISLIFYQMLEKKSNKNIKMMFEAGMLEINPKKMAFSTNFLTFSLLFLVFDVEISFLIPTIINKNFYGSKMIITSMLFITMLTMILAKEWKHGTMEWNK